MAALVASTDVKTYRESDDGHRPGAIPHSEITDKEWEMLELFRRTAAKDVDFTDAYLTYDVVLRFLRARDLDIPKATKMLMVI